MVHILFEQLKAILVCDLAWNHVSCQLLIRCVLSNELENLQLLPHCLLLCEKILVVINCLICALVMMCRHTHTFASVLRCRLTFLNVQTPGLWKSLFLHCSNNWRNVNRRRCVIGNGSARSCAGKPRRSRYLRRLARKFFYPHLLDSALDF